MRCRHDWPCEENGGERREERLGESGRGMDKDRMETLIEILA